MPDRIPGPRKAAVFLMSIGEVSARDVLAAMDKAAVDQVVLELARLESNPPTREERESILREFRTISSAYPLVEQGGAAQARRVLEASIPEDAQRMTQALEEAVRATPFGFLHRVGVGNLVSFLQNEHPQTIALVLSHAGSAQGAAILQALPVQRQQEVIRRLATMEETSTEVVEHVEKVLQEKLQGIGGEGQRSGGVRAAAEILNHLQRATERSILDAIEQESPDVAREIRRVMFTFEDALRINDRGIQNVLMNVDKSQLALALKTAAPEIRDKFFRNMSSRAVQEVQETLEFMGPVRVGDIEAAQQGVVDVIRKLEEEGQVIVEGRGGVEKIVI